LIFKHAISTVVISKPTHSAHGAGVGIPGAPLASGDATEESQP
jgi:hypothetical protein